MARMDQPARSRVIIGVLALARARVTADDVAVKEERRDRLQQLRRQVILHGEGEGSLPSKAALREALGDDDALVREALEDWPS